MASKKPEEESLNGQFIEHLEVMSEDEPRKDLKIEDKNTNLTELDTEIKPSNEVSKATETEPLILQSTEHLEGTAEDAACILDHENEGANMISIETNNGQINPLNRLCKNENMEETSEDEECCNSELESWILIEADAEMKLLNEVSKTLETEPLILQSTEHLEGTAEDVAFKDLENEDGNMISIGTNNGQISPSIWLCKNDECKNCELEGCTLIEADAEIKPSNEVSKTLETEPLILKSTEHLEGTAEDEECKDLENEDGNMISIETNNGQINPSNRLSKNENMEETSEDEECNNCELKSCTLIEADAEIKPSDGVSKNTESNTPEKEPSLLWSECMEETSEDEEYKDCESGDIDMISSEPNEKIQRSNEVSTSVTSKTTESATRDLLQTNHMYDRPFQWKPQQWRPPHLRKTKDAKKTNKTPAPKLNPLELAETIREYQRLRKYNPSYRTSGEILPQKAWWDRLTDAKTYPSIAFTDDGFVYNDNNSRTLHLWAGRETHRDEPAEGFAQRWQRKIPHGISDPQEMYVVPGADARTLQDLLVVRDGWGVTTVLNMPRTTSGPGSKFSVKYVVQEERLGRLVGVLNGRLVYARGCKRDPEQRCKEWPTEIPLKSHKAPEQDHVTSSFMFCISTQQWIETKWINGVAQKPVEKPPYKPRYCKPREEPEAYELGLYFVYDHSFKGSFSEVFPDDKISLVMHPETGVVAVTSGKDTCLRIFPGGVRVENLGDASPLKVTLPERPILRNALATVNNFLVVAGDERMWAYSWCGERLTTWSVGQLDIPVNHWVRAVGTRRIKPREGLPGGEQLVMVAGLGNSVHTYNILGDKPPGPQGGEVGKRLRLVEVWGFGLLGRLLLGMAVVILLADSIYGFVEAWFGRFLG